jgi:Tfp pilus assembly protein PilO
MSSGVSIRSLTAQPVAQRQYYYEMPFSVEADGPYFAVLDFFGKLGRLSRIINVGDLKLSAIGSNNPGGALKFHMTPGTTVTGTFTITTFFTNPVGQVAPTAKPVSAPVRR